MIRSLLTDILAMIGFGGVAVGLWWISPPYSLIVCGGMLLILGVLGARQ